MQELCNAKGCDYLHSLLCNVDSESAENIHPNNVKRVIRALEYHHATGEKISDYNKRTLEIESPYTVDRIYFTRSRENLYDRIDRRVDIMLNDGLENEVRSIIEKYPDENTYAPLISKNEYEEGTGHNSVIKYDGEYYVIYHGRDVIDDGRITGDKRTARICRLTLDGEKLTAVRDENKLV
jgi:tRNA dimethylallyltransferase